MVDHRLRTMFCDIGCAGSVHRDKLLATLDVQNDIENKLHEAQNDHLATLDG